jgi:hypothetical protein
MSHFLFPASCLYGPGWAFRPAIHTTDARFMAVEKGISTEAVFTVHHPEIQRPGRTDVHTHGTGKACFPAESWYWFCRLSFHQHTQFSFSCEPYINVTHPLPCSLIPAVMAFKNEDRSISLIRAFFTGGSLKNAPTIPRMID